ncbi:MAG TPA: T9SS type A sorting domain-containing protein [Parafilimonas sp.]|nr:T9SS type A sorting domain-containing protein [Parafilimonas sp.]
MNANIYPSKSNYYKAESRLERNIQSGKFATYTLQKKQRIWKRLCRYARQLGINVKSSVAAACIAAGLAIGAPASAQITFVEQTGSSNPLNSVVMPSNLAIPAFVDIDADGDQDVFIGSFNDPVSYYKNTGTASAPVYTLQTGSNNPLNGVTGVLSTLAFVDIDGDGDKDVFMGSYDGPVSYYKNTGTTAAPVFTLQTDANNPLNQVTAYNSSPAFVDIDGDGDQDVFIGSFYGQVYYYKNTGTTTAPVFTEQTGADNPLGDEYFYNAVPAFVDIDHDGDKDVFFGSLYGGIYYFKNTGTANSPAFAVQADADNPLAMVNLYYTYPAFVDIDADGDQDVFVGAYGESGGTVSYFKNTSVVLPLHLISFKGSAQTGYNELQWQTAGEINTKSFEIERSNDSKNFSKIATVASRGTGNNSYTIHDNITYNGNMFYRLKMIDQDGKFSYSGIISIISTQAGKIIVYPNPATNVINMHVGNAGILKTQAGIFDAKGRLVQNVPINNDQQQINIQSLAKGVYVIRFADGSSIKFIKQ